MLLLLITIMFINNIVLIKYKYTISYNWATLKNYNKPIYEKISLLVFTDIFNH